VISLSLLLCVDAHAGLLINKVLHHGCSSLEVQRLTDIHVLIYASLVLTGSTL
jgi:hypothetical protein